MALIKINGINVNISVTGAGHPLMLIHGVGNEHTQYNELISFLSENFKVIAWDCRGHGKSDKPNHYVLEDHIKDALSIMEYFKIKDAYVNGISMGSYIAQGMAVNAPDSIRKLILTVPKSNGLTSSVTRIMKAHEDELKGLTPHETVLALLKYFVYNTEIMRAHTDIFETTLTPSQFAAANNALKDFDFRDHLPKITAKTLVISGKYDGLNPREEGKLTASLIPGARYVEMQFSGHAPMFEEAEKYRSLIRTFFLED